MISEISDEAADLIIEAILIQTIKDYEFALKHKDIEPMNKSQEYTKNLAIKLKGECESFVHSNWYSMMCEIDGDKLLNMIIQHFNEYDCSILADKEIKKKNKRKVPLNCDLV